MKLTIKPPQQEEAVYYSDFSGKCFGNYQPEAVISFNFNYGSKYDGDSVSFHLSDEEAELMLNVIKSKLSEDYKKTLNDNLKGQEQSLQDSVDARDYIQSDYYSRSISLLRFLLKN